VEIIPKRGLLPAHLPNWHMPEKRTGRRGCSFALNVAVIG